MNGSSHDNVIDGVAARYVSHAMVLDGSYAANSSTTGFLIAGTHQTLENSAISFSSGNGVNLSGTGNTVSNCLIHDVDYVTSDCAAVSPSGSDATIASNTLYNGGRSLLLFKLPSSKATHNLIYGAGLQADDLGGVYTYGTDGAESEVAYNVVHTDPPAARAQGHRDLPRQRQQQLHRPPQPGVRPLRRRDDHQHREHRQPHLQQHRMLGGIHGGGTDPGVQIVNNIFTGAIRIGTGATVSDNLVGPADPEFVDAAAVATTSSRLARPPSTWARRSLPYTNGYVGSAPDLGAFERGAPPWSAGSSLTSDGF